LDTRKHIPLYQQRRFDIYHDVAETAEESSDGKVVFKKWQLASSYDNAK
jgi:hypothetical protein